MAGNYTNRIHYIKKKILEELTKKQYAQVFMRPLDERDQKLIKNPMDLGTIINRVQNRQYRNAFELIIDLRLVYQNWFAMKNANPVLCRPGNQLQNFVEKKLSQMPGGPECEISKDSRMTVKSVQGFPHLQMDSIEPMSHFSIFTPIKTEPVVVKKQPGTVKKEPEAVKSVPVGVKTEPVDVKTVPVRVKTEPVDVKTVPMGIRTVPVGVKTVLVGVKTEPVDVKTVPMDVETVPMDVETVPVGVKTVPVGVKTVPVGVKTESMRVETVPMNVETVPMRVKTQPVVVGTESTDDPMELIEPVLVSVKREPVDANTELMHDPAHHETHPIDANDPLCTISKIIGKAQLQHYLQAPEPFIDDPDPDDCSTAQFEDNCKMWDRLVDDLTSYELQIVMHIAVQTNAPAFIKNGKVEFNLTKFPRHVISLMREALFLSRRQQAQLTQLMTADDQKLMTDSLETQLDEITAKLSTKRTGIKRSHPPPTTQESHEQEFAGPAALAKMACLSDDEEEEEEKPIENKETSHRYHKYHKRSKRYMSKSHYAFE